MTDATADAPQVPMPRECPHQLPSGYTSLRAQGALAQVTLDGGRRAWFVTGHREARTLLADSRISADVTDPRYPEFIRIPSQHRTTPAVLRENQTFVQMDLPEHRTYRKMVIPNFTVRRVAALRPAIQAAADTLLDRMTSKGPPTDLVSAYAVPLPALVLAELFGVPEPGRELFHECLTGVRGIGELGKYFGRLLTDRSVGLEEGVLGTVIGRFREGELSGDRAVSTLMMLIVAGHETTENMIALGALMLLEHPDQLRRLRADPSALPGAVDELLRYVSIADVLLRVAKADIDVAGRTIRSGDAVVVSLAAANRDDDAFAHPDVFDVDRPTGRHAAFGHGPHQCLGNNVARLELRVGLSTLFERIPTLGLALPADRLPVKPAHGLQGVAELPVTWQHTGR